MNDTNDIIFTSLSTGAIVIKQDKQFQVYSENRLISTSKYKDAAVMSAIAFQADSDQKKE